MARPRFVACTLAALLALCVGTASARASVSVGDQARPCECVTITVPVPEPLRETAPLAFEVRLSGSTTVTGQTEGMLDAEQNAHLVLTLWLPADATAGILDVADVVFRSEAQPEVVVPILLRVPADSTAVRVTCESCVGRADGAIVPRGLWSAGVEGGIGSSGLAGETAGFDQGRIGLSATVFADRALNPQWSLRAGLGFAQRGGASKLSGSTVVIAVNYLEVPVLARYRLPMIGSITPVVYGGPSIALRLTCSLRFSGTGPNSSESCDDEAVGGQPRVADAGLTLGLGAEVPFGPARVELGGRLLTGLVSIGAPLDVRNSGWAMVAGATIPAAMLRRPTRGAR